MFGGSFYTCVGKRLTMAFLGEIIDAGIRKVLREKTVSLRYRIGTMMVVARAETRSRRVMVPMRFTDSPLL